MAQLLEKNLTKIVKSIFTFTRSPRWGIQMRPAVILYIWHEPRRLSSFSRLQWAVTRIHMAGGQHAKKKVLKHFWRVFQTCHCKLMMHPLSFLFLLFLLAAYGKIKKDDISHTVLWPANTRRTGVNGRRLFNEETPGSLTVMSRCLVTAVTQWTLHYICKWTSAIFRE